jgi:hypothetical protein
MASGIRACVPVTQGDVRATELRLGPGAERPRPAPLERGVLSVAITPQDWLVLDTGALIEALLEDRPHHNAYADHLARSVEHGTTFAYSDLVEQWSAHRHDGRALWPARDLTHRVMRSSSGRRALVMR